MKNIGIISLMLFIATTACNKSQNYTTKDTEKTTLESENLKGKPVEQIYHYTCSGTCTDGSECAMYHNIQGNYVECTCEGCTLNVSIESTGGNSQPKNKHESIDKLFSKDMFLKELTSFVETKHKTNDFKLTSIEMAEYGEDYYLLYDYITLDGHAESVMYAYVHQTREEEPEKKYEIDCSGSCDQQGESCRERFNFNPPSAECTCESDNCNMTVSEL